MLFDYIQIWPGAVFVVALRILLFPHTDVFFSHTIVSAGLHSFHE